MGRESASSSSGGAAPSWVVECVQMVLTALPPHTRPTDLGVFGKQQADSAASDLHARLELFPEATKFEHVADLFIVDVCSNAATLFPNVTPFRPLPFLSACHERAVKFTNMNQSLVALRDFGLQMQASLIKMARLTLVYPDLFVSTRFAVEHVSCQRLLLVLVRGHLSCTFVALFECPGRHQRPSYWRCCRFPNGHPQHSLRVFSLASKRLMFRRSWAARWSRSSCAALRVQTSQLSPHPSCPFADCCISASLVPCLLPIRAGCQREILGWLASSACWAHFSVHRYIPATSQLWQRNCFLVPP
eukprot:m.581815 g.581815  ORF g.581815 m.581815 type:complete len:303 (+) comp57940_c1_seq2:57-965(+)